MPKTSDRQPGPETTQTDACPNDCGDHCGNPAWTREDHDARTDRLRPLADHLRVGHDVLPEQRRYADTWLHIALLADEWVEARLAEVLAEHAPFWTAFMESYLCGCGWSPSSERATYESQWAQHVAEVVGRPASCGPTGGSR